MDGEERGWNLKLIGIGAAATVAVVGGGVGWYFYRRRLRSLGMMPEYTNMKPFGTRTFQEVFAHYDPIDRPTLRNEALALMKTSIKERLDQGDVGNMLFLEDCALLLRSLQDEPIEEWFLFAMCFVGSLSASEKWLDMASACESLDQQIAAGGDQNAFFSSLSRERKDDVWHMYRSYAQACSAFGRYELAFVQLQRASQMVEPDSFLAACTLLLQADLCNVYAQRLEKNSGNPLFEELCARGVQLCREARVIFDKHKGQLKGDQLFSKPENLMMNLYNTWGLMDESEQAVLDLLDLLQQTDPFVSPIHYAQLYEDYAILALDRESAPDSMEKAVWAYEKAFSYYRAIPGLDGITYETFRRAELGSRMMARGIQVEEARRWIDAARQFSEENRLGPALLEHDSVRVVSCKMDIERRRREKMEGNDSGDKMEDLDDLDGDNEDDDAAAVDGLFLIRLRLKRRIENKKARIAAGSTLSIHLAQWNDRQNILEGSQAQMVLTKEVLDSPHRDRRIVNFSLTVRPSKTSYVCIIRVDGHPTLEQHVPSFVDCHTATWKEAKEIMKTIDFERCYKG